MIIRRSNCASAICTPHSQWRSWITIVGLILLFHTEAFGYSSRALRVLNDIQSIAQAIECYRMEFGRYPSTTRVWTELTEKTFLPRGQFSNPVDQWKHSIRYRAPGLHGRFDVYSVGADGVDNDGQGDDISNWAGVNEGSYWKSDWPLGQATFHWGVGVGLASLLLGFRYPLKLVLPLAGAIIAFAIMLGSQLQTEPLIGSSHNGPVERDRRAGTEFLFLFGVLFVVSLRCPRIFYRKSPTEQITQKKSHACVDRRGSEKNEFGSD